MTSSNLLWLSASPSLKWIDAPLISQLSKLKPLYFWEYRQTEDESSCLNKAVEMLYSYLSPFRSQNRAPMHLIGHGISGVVGLLFTRKYPDLVRSLTLLSVGVQPAATWHAHYYAKRHFFGASQLQTLMYMSQQLFGQSPPYSIRQLATLLMDDLGQAPSPHSAYRTTTLPQGGVKVPLLTCGGEHDAVSDAITIYSWSPWLKPSDVTWFCPQGKHFFHYDHPQITGQAIEQFVSHVEKSPSSIANQGLQRFAIAIEDS